MQNCQALRMMVEDGAPVDGAPSSQFLTNLVPTSWYQPWYLTPSKAVAIAVVCCQILRPQARQGVPTCVVQVVRHFHHVLRSR